MEGFFSSGKNKDIKNSVVEINIDKVRPNPYQPRKVFDTASIYELAESIKEFGVIQPISVRKAHKGAYELIAGERRLRACMYLKLQKVPAIIVDMNDNDSAVVALIENLQRRDLTFFEEAEAYFHLITEHGLTQEEVAKKVGKNQSTVANKLRLLKLPKDVKAIIKENNLTERHARALLKLPDEKLQRSVAQRVVKNGYNVSETEEIVEKTLLKLTGENKEKRIVKTAVLKDVRIFANTIKKAVSVMRMSGIDAVSIQNEGDKFYEYIIKIPKKCSF